MRQVLRRALVAAAAGSMLLTGCSSTVVGSASPGEGEPSDVTADAFPITASDPSNAVDTFAAKSVVDNVINTSGIVEAKSASLVNGQIVLDGGDAGRVQVAGRLDASGQAASNNVQVLGDKIKVAGATASSLKATGGSISNVFVVRSSS